MNLSIVPIGLLTLCLTAQAQDATITQTQITATQFQRTTAQIETMATQWELEPEEVERYLDYMDHEGQYFYNHLDPVMVLGIIETDTAKRDDYAAKYLMAERRRVEQQVLFATTVAQAQQRLFGPESIVSFAKLPQATNSPRYLKARARKQGKSQALQLRPPATPIPVANVQTMQPQIGDVIDLLVDTACTRACYDALTHTLAVDDVTVNLYVKGYTGNAGVVEWFTTWLADHPTPTDADRIALKRFDPVLFGEGASTKTPVAFLRRDGVVIARR